MPVFPTIPENTIRVHTANGKGSTNTGCRRWTTVEDNTGGAVTYTDSGTLGGYFTIVEPGLYDCQGEDGDSSVISNAGATIDSSSLTVGYFGVAIAERWGGSNMATTTSNAYGFSGSARRFAGGEVIRVQVIGSSGTSNARFSISKIGE